MAVGRGLGRTIGVAVGAGVAVGKGVGNTKGVAVGSGVGNSGEEQATLTNNNTDAPRNVFNTPMELPPQSDAYRPSLSACELIDSTPRMLGSSKPRRHRFARSNVRFQRHRSPCVLRSVQGMEAELLPKR